MIGQPDSSSAHISSTGSRTTVNNTIPQRVPALEGFFIEDIAVGSEHTLALTNEGQVWAWGSNRDGQLGLGHYHYVIEPVIIQDLADKNIKQVALNIIFVIKAKLLP